MSTSREKPKGDVKLTPNPVNDRSLAIEKSQKEQMSNIKRIIEIQGK